jgi:hypothetical protein
MTIEDESLTTQEEVIQQEQPVDIKETIAKQLEEADKEPEKVEEPETKEEPPAEEYKAKLNGYDNQAREVLSKLPADVQKIIDAREEKFHKGIEGYKQAANFAQNVGKILAPDVQYLQQYNITPDQFLTRLVTAERQLRSNDPRVKLNAAHAIMQDYGVDLGMLTQTQYDPKLQQLQNENMHYRSYLEQAQASRQSAEVDQAREMISEFGQSREFFDQLKPVMADLLDKGLATTLDEAYAKAIRLDETVFQQYQAKQLEELKKQDSLKANQAAQAAKAAAVSVRGGSPSGISHAQTPANTQEAVRFAMEQLGL